MLGQRLSITLSSWRQHILIEDDHNKVQRLISIVVLLFFSGLYRHYNSCLSLPFILSSSPERGHAHGCNHCGGWQIMFLGAPFWCHNTSAYVSNTLKQQASFHFLLSSVLISSPLLHSPDITILFQVIFCKDESMKHLGFMSS